MLRLPKPRPRTAAEIDFLALGEGAHRWLTEAAAGGVVRIRHKMARAVEFAHVHGRRTGRSGIGRGRGGGPVRRP